MRHVSQLTSWCVLSVLLHSSLWASSSFSVILRCLSGPWRDVPPLASESTPKSPFLTTSASSAALSSWLYSAHRLRMVSSLCRSCRRRCETWLRAYILDRIADQLGVSLCDIVPFRQLSLQSCTGSMEQLYCNMIAGELKLLWFVSEEQSGGGVGCGGVAK